MSRAWPGETMEDLLKTILAEVRNLSYLFFGYAVIWILLFGYLYSLSRRERDLRNEIERLKVERSEMRSEEQTGRHD